MKLLTEGGILIYCRFWSLRLTFDDEEQQDRMLHLHTSQPFLANGKCAMCVRAENTEANWKYVFAEVT